MSSGMDARMLRLAEDFLKSGAGGGFGELFDPGVFLSLGRPRGDLEGEPSEDGMGLGLLRAFLARGILESRTKDLAGAESRLLDTSSESGETVRQWLAGLKTGASSGFDAPPDAVLSLGELTGRRLEAWEEASQTLGYGSHYALLADCFHHDIEGLAAAAAAFLQETDWAYGDVLSWALKRASGPEATSLTHEGLLYLLNSGEYVEHFPARGLTETLTRFTGELGYPALASITFTFTGAPEWPRAPAVRAAGAPGPVGIFINPLGSIEDYELALGSLAGALSLAMVNPDDHLEFRWLREGAAAEALGSVFSGLVQEPLWLRRYAGVEGDRDSEMLLAFRMLALTRLLAGKVLYLTSLHTGRDYSRAQTLYTESIGKSLQIEPLSWLYALETEPFLAPANSLTGSALALSLHTYLTESFDEEWWRVEPARDVLGGLLAAGGRTIARGLLGLAGGAEGHGGLDPLLAFFENRLG